MAVVRADAANDDFNRRVSEALGLDHNAAAQPPVKRPVTRAILNKVALHQRSRISDKFRRYAIMREAGGAAEEFADAMIANFELDAKDLQAILLQDSEVPSPPIDLDAITSDVIAFEQYDAPTGSLDRAAIRRAVREGTIQGYRDANGILDGSLSVLATSPQRRDKVPRISAAVGTYIEGQTKTRTIAEVKGALKSFIQEVGDLPLDELRSEHFRMFCSREAARDVGGASKGSVQRPVSEGTLKKKIGLLRAAISHAIDRDEFDGPNPASGIKVSAYARPTSKSQMPDKRPFSRNELNRGFSYPWFTGCASNSKMHQPGTHRLGGMYYWGPISALMTGCRAGELGGLALDEVILDDQCPHILIRDNAFRSTKGSYRRKIPILDQLLELGFGAFVEARKRSGGTRLFDDWQAPRGMCAADDPAWSNSKMVRSFNTTLIPKALDGLLLPDARREVTFHSFRGSFKSLLIRDKYNISTNYVHEVVGHSKSALDQRYVREIPLEETYNAVRKCRFEGLQIPPPPPA